MEREELKLKLLQLIKDYKNLTPEQLKMSENSTKANFVDRLLIEVLGWERNKIKWEEPVETTEFMKRADYSYPSIPKIIVEAKKLSVQIEVEEVGKFNKFEQQVINYSYNSAVNWAVLTNFKYFKAFYVTRDDANYFCDCELTDESKLEENINHLIWFTNANLLSKNIDEEAERRKIKIKEINITEDLTYSLNEARLHLNNYIKKEYKNRYSDEDIEELTQGILNRLIFIKKLEAEDIELPALERIRRHESEKVYDKVKSLFQSYREKYDSDIFGIPAKKHQVEELDIENGVINRVIEGISKPKESNHEYNFAAIDVDVLGSVYENYLAYIQKGIKLVGGRAKRKEQGIYYTPKYVVNYIVNNTLGNVLSRYDLSKIKGLKVLDMACGSGSFLIGALKEFDNNYNKNIKNYDKFSIRSKLDVIKNNLYGVDLDEKAITIAELNIYLTLLTLAKKQKVIETHESLLPELKDNIKVGNSLIDDKDVAKGKEFNWDEKFNAVGKGKFDIIVGNPPYINIRLLTKNNASEKSFYEKNYNSASGNYDIYVVFLERAISLLKEGGRLGFIVPNKFTVTDYGLEVRKLILSTCSIEKIIDVSNLKVFRGVGIYPIILILKKQRNATNRNTNQIKTAVISDERELFENLKYSEIEQKRYLENDDNIFVFGSHIKQLDLINKLKEKSVPLNEVAVVNSGTTGFEYTNWGRYITNMPENDSIPFIITGNIEEYIINSEKPVRYQGKKLVRAFFKKGRDVTEGKWKLFSTKKLVIRGMALKLTAAYDDVGSACGVSVYTITQPREDVDLFYLLGMLNSKLIDYFYKSQFISKHLAGKYIGYNKGQIEQIPVRICNKSKQNEVSELVKKRITLSKDFIKTSIKGGRKELQLKEEIDSIDKKINDLIYEIYEVSDAKELIERS